jgi:glycosyltransferase involved in cell wall biosynthesis
VSSYSVIVTACNNAAVLPRALRSVEDAIAFAAGANPLPTPPGGEGRVRGVADPAAAEIVIVDDGSADATPDVLAALTRGKDFYTVLRRPTPTSPAAARNAGVAADHVSSGDSGIGPDPCTGQRPVRR